MVRLFLLLIVTGIISLCVIFFSDEIINLTAPSFQNNPQKFQIASNLTKMTAFFLPLISFAALSMGALNTKKIFFIPSLAPAAFNVVMISSIFGVTYILQQNGFEIIYALGIGVLFGGFVQFIVQVPLLFKNGFIPTRDISLLSKSVRKIIGRLGIGTIGVAATQINLLINTLLATNAEIGAVSFLSYGFRLFQFPVGILGVSVSGANLVHFSADWKAGRKEKAISVLNTSFTLSLFFMIPSTFFLFENSSELVKIIFERGAFYCHAPEKTSLALQYYVFGLPFYGIYKVFGPTFFSMDKEKLPVFISIFSIAVNIVFCLFLTPKYGFQVLALGMSLSIALNSLLQSVFISKLLSLSFNFFVSWRVLRIIVASLIAYFIMIFFKKFLGWEESLVSQITHLVSSALVFGIVYVMTIWPLGEREFVGQLFEKIKKKM